LITAIDCISAPQQAPTPTGSCSGCCLAGGARDDAQARLTPARVSVARAQGGVTHASKEGESRADFTDLGGCSQEAASLTQSNPTSTFTWNDMASEMTFESGWRDLTSSKPTVCKRKGVIQVCSCFSSDDRGHRPNANPKSKGSNSLCENTSALLRTPSGAYTDVRFALHDRTTAPPSAPSPALSPLLSATAKS
jgi:hypothetical protein